MNNGDSSLITATLLRSKCLIRPDIRIELSRQSIELCFTSAKAYLDNRYLAHTMNNFVGLQFLSKKVNVSPISSTLLRHMLHLERIKVNAI